MICVNELLSVNQEILKSQFIELLFKEELITESVYYKALELVEEGKSSGNTK